MKASRYEAYSEVPLSVSGDSILLSLYNDTPSAPTLLFLPGTMVHPLFYDRLLSNIASSGINVVGIHFVSHGKSPRERENFTFEDLVGNVRAAIDFCIKRYGENLIVLGSSQGSMVAAAAVAGNSTVKALFLHDLFLPQLKQSREIPRLPWWIRPFGKVLPLLLRMAAALFPTYQVPLQHYLDPGKLTKSKAMIETFLNDPLCRKSYPLSFIASLFNMELSCAVDGSIKVPLVMITAKEDPLFKQDYMDQVFEKLVAPEKVMVTFDLSYHTIFVEGADEVSERLIEMLSTYFMR